MLQAGDKAILMSRSTFNKISWFLRFYLTFIAMIESQFEPNCVSVKYYFSPSFQCPFCRPTIFFLSLFNKHSYSQVYCFCPRTYELKGSGSTVKWKSRGRVMPLVRLMPVSRALYWDNIYSTVDKLHWFRKRVLILSVFWKRLWSRILSMYSNFRVTFSEPTFFTTWSVDWILRNLWFVGNVNSLHGTDSDW